MMLQLLRGAAQGQAGPYPRSLRIEHKSTNPASAANQIAS